jgi:hypothetical protein
VTVVSFPYIDSEIDQIDQLRARAPRCRLVGLNIDERQRHWAGRLLAPAPAIPVVAGDGCRLPVAGTAVDHVQAVECVFHFPSRKAFFVGDWFGRSATPLTPAGYERLGRAAGFDLLSDDVTPRRLPTYAALRRLHRDGGPPAGIATIDAVESLARGGGWQYHVLSFRRRAGRA